MLHPLLDLVCLDTIGHFPMFDVVRGGNGSASKNFSELSRGRICSLSSIAVGARRGIWAVR